MNIEQYPHTRIFELANSLFFTFRTTVIPDEVWANVDLRGTGSYGGVRTIRLTKIHYKGRWLTFYIKSPEYRFSGDTERIKSGDFWWGGFKSGERPVLYKGLESQIQLFYEALILCKLEELNIRAELPQAIVERDGEMVLVTLSARCDERQSLMTSKLEILRVLYANYILPVDYADHNVVHLERGEKCIIDVNRWVALEFLEIRETLWSYLKRLRGIE